MRGALCRSFTGSKALSTRELGSIDNILGLLGEPLEMHQTSGSAAASSGLEHGVETREASERLCGAGG